MYCEKYFCASFLVYNHNCFLRIKVLDVALPNQRTWTFYVFNITIFSTREAIIYTSMIICTFLYPHQNLVSLILFFNLENLKDQNTFMNNPVNTDGANFVFFIFIAISIFLLCISYWFVCACVCGGVFAFIFVHFSIVEVSFSQWCEKISNRIMSSFLDLYCCKCPHAPKLTLLNFLKIKNLTFI